MYKVTEFTIANLDRGKAMFNKARILPLVSVCTLAVFLVAAPAAAQRGREEVELPKKEFSLVKEYWRTPVKSQGRTGTCWTFATISFIESEAYRLGNGEFELSEPYNAYVCYLAKADAFIRMHGNNNFGEGGLFHDVLWVLKHYGAVRDSDYTGMWPDEEILNFSEMQNALKGYLDGVLNSRHPSQKWKKGFKSTLSAFMMQPPETVTVDGKEMIPKEFADNVLGVDVDDYVSLTSFTHMPFYERVELLIPDNWAHNDDYVNIPLDDFMAVMDYAVENGFTVAIGGDVSEGTFNQGKWGYGIVEQDKEGKVVTPEEREEMWDNWSSTDDHAMHVVGYATDEEGNRFYYTKNSWGTKNGPYEGYCYFSQNFIRAKMNNILVHKDAVPAEIRAKLPLD